VIQASLDGIQSGGHGLETQLNQILQSINTLRAKVTEALVYLPTYDEQQYMKVTTTGGTLFKHTGNNENGLYRDWQIYQNNLIRNELNLLHVRNLHFDLVQLL
jgi:hypothetical protein